MVEPESRVLHGYSSCKATDKTVCGFVPLSEGIESTPPPAPHNGLTPTDTPDFQGVINSILTSDQHISENKCYESERPPTRSKLRRKNRKYATRKDTMLIDGEEYKINVTARSGVFTQMVKRTHSELQWLIAKVKRVHIHIFDLHHAGLHTLDNKRISRLLKNAGRRIKRHYSTEYMGYLWVREQERGKAQHYHFMVFIDGKKAQHPHFLREAFAQEWFNICGGSLSYPKRCYYNLNSKKPDFQKIKADIIYRISYRAKQRGKGYRPPQTNDYSTSRLCPAKG